MALWSRFAVSLKPNVAYLALNFAALWKKQTTLPSLAYAGIPYQVLGASWGAFEAMSLWSRWAILRSDGGISAIFARQSASASALLPLAFRSFINSFIAAFSSAVNTLEAARRVGFFVAGIGTSPFTAGSLFMRSVWQCP